MAPPSGEWRLVLEEDCRGPMAMALDEAAAETAAAGGPRTLRVYRWRPGTLSLGYAQPADTVDWTYCEREGITVVRRPTGGGGIYHDPVGDISYSIVAPADEIPGDLMASYDLLLEPVLDAFARMGIDAGLAADPQPALYEPACYLRPVDPAHDVVVDGRKISGNAQYRQRGAVIQHGSITYARTTDRHLACFADHGVSPAAFEDRVTSIRAETGIERTVAVDALEAALADWADAERGEWDDTEIAVAEDRVAERYATDGWTRRR